MSSKSNKQRVRRSRGAQRIDQNAVTRVRARSFHNVSYNTVANTTTVAEHNIVVANMGARIVAIADAFMYWRIIAMRIHGVTKCGITATTNVPSELHFHGISFMPASLADYTAPTTLAQFIDFPDAKFGSARNEVDVSVSRKGLIGSLPYKWLHTTTTGVTTELQCAGTITVVLENGAVTYTSASQFDYYVEYLVEFKGPLDTALNPSFAVKCRDFPTREFSGSSTTKLPPPRLHGKDEEKKNPPEKTSCSGEPDTSPGGWLLGTFRK